MDISDGELAPREMRIRWRNLFSIPIYRINHRHEIIIMEFLRVFAIVPSAFGISFEPALRAAWVVPDHLFLREQPLLPQPPHLLVSPPFRIHHFVFTSYFPPLSRHIWSYPTFQNDDYLQIRSVFHRQSPYSHYVMNVIFHLKCIGQERPSNRGEP
jgi:hypothetical protein